MADKYNLIALQKTLEQEKLTKKLDMEISPVDSLLLKYACFVRTQGTKTVAMIYTASDGINLDLHVDRKQLLKYSYSIIQLNADTFQVTNVKTYKKALEAISKDPSLSIVYAKNYSLKELVALLVDECCPLHQRAKRIYDHLAHKYRWWKTLQQFILDMSAKAESRIEEKIKFAPTTYSLDYEDEERLFNILYATTKPIDSVCRYTSLRSLMLMLAHKTTRLNGLAGMNDKSESLFLQEQLYGHQEIKDDINHSYIMSCSDSSLIDNLDMWRMYAEDGKGVCLIYDVEYPIPSEFTWAPVLYDYAKTTKKRSNYKFTFLKDIVRLFAKHNLTFQFKQFKKWQTFTKSGDYCNEQEIRLLHITKEGEEHPADRWMLTDKNSIVTPFVEYALCDMKVRTLPTLPLKLKGIVLGPKCPEKELNKQQLEAMIACDPVLRDMGLNVVLSTIENYR